MSKRIYQIAKELNISHIQIIKFLESKDIKVANHMAFVDNDTYASILFEFSQEKKQVDRNTKERARKVASTMHESINQNEINQESENKKKERQNEIKQDRRTRRKT